MKRTIKKENRNPHEKMRKQMGKKTMYINENGKRWKKY
jgi:hypothetical protein